MKRDKQLPILKAMFSIYCKKKHKSKKELCPECSSVFEYAKNRLSRCPFGDDKPFCSHCKIHCYKKDMSEKMKEIMRFSGPRMLFYHPILAFSHIFGTIKMKIKQKKKI